MTIGNVLSITGLIYLGYLIAVADENRTSNSDAPPIAPDKNSGTLPLKVDIRLRRHPSTKAWFSYSASNGAFSCFVKDEFEGQKSLFFDRGGFRDTPKAFAFLGHRFTFTNYGNYFTVVFKEKNIHDNGWNIIHNQKYNF